jgi:trehalose 6-phosphate phosphatase
VLLTLDYDGTLTPIVSRPDLAVLPAGVRALLVELTGNSKYLVGVISGRSLEDVREKVDVEGIVYAGNHGLEMEGPGVRFLHPEAKSLKGLLEQVCRDLGDNLAHYPGVVVENKGLTLSVHYRMTPNSLANEVEEVFKATVLSFRDSAQVKITGGKKVLEVRPNVEWHKGKAIGKLMELHPEVSLAAFFGDDLTDEDAFAAVQDANGIAVFVGPTRQPTKALHRVDSPEEVSEALRLMAQL